jgi:DHA1 family tetracycline resistance protein-like MFS transporter
MANGKSPIVIVFVTVFIDLIGFGIVIPILPLYAETFHARPATIGMLLASFSAMQFIFSPILGRLSDRVGRRPVLLLSLIGTSIGFLIMGLAGSLLMLFAGRIIDGITGGNISTAQAYIADVTPPERRSSGMGLIGAAFGLGFIFGPAIGGVLSHISLAAPFVFASALAAANSVALYFLLPESLAPEHRTAREARASALKVFNESGGRRLGAITLTYFFATVAFSMLTATYALFTESRFHYDARQNGYIFAYLGVIGALIQGGLLGRLSRIFGDKQLMVAGALVLAVSMFFLPASATIGLLLLASTGIAIGNSLMTPTLNALASKSVGALWQGRVLGVMQSSASLARIIGPVVGGLLLESEATSANFGRAPYWGGGLLMLVAFGIALTVRAKKQEETPAVVSGH